jgi:hypothetical protein
VQDGKVGVVEIEYGDIGIGTGAKNVVLERENSVIDGIEGGK